MHLNERQTAFSLFLGALFLPALLAAVFSTAHGFTHRISPVLLSLGPLELRFYGLVYFTGYITIYLMLHFLVKSGRIPVPRDTLEPLVLLMIFSMLLGARLFEVLIYDPAYYFSQPSRMLRLWEGGLSFHGALAGITAACAVYARWQKINLFTLTDRLVIPVFFFLFLGRFANFVNGELYGAVTALPWGVKFPDAAGLRHPTQIYEALKNLLLAAGANWLRTFQPPRGVLSGFFLTGYGILRFLIEFLKNYGEYKYKTLISIPGLNIAQILCLLMAAAGAAIMIKAYRKRETV